MSWKGLFLKLNVLGDLLPVRLFYEPSLRGVLIGLFSTEYIDWFADIYWALILFSKRPTTSCLSTFSISLCIYVSMNFWTLMKPPPTRTNTSLPRSTLTCTRRYPNLYTPSDSLRKRIFMFFLSGYLFKNLAMAISIGSPALPMYIA